MAEALTPLRPPDTLAQSTAELLRERLLGGAFAPGQRLVEAEIARQLGISRGPVREALARLRAEGLAYEEPRRGSFVAALSAEDVREIYELRAALESQAARLLIERGDGAGFAPLDAEFHEELCRSSGNSRLHRTFVTHAGVLRTLLWLEVITQYEELGGLLRAHEALWAEIASRDVSRAEQACNQHLAQALE